MSALRGLSNDSACWAAVSKRSVRAIAGKLWSDFVCHAARDHSESPYIRHIASECTIKGTFCWKLLSREILRVFSLYSTLTAATASAISVSTH